jgi:hypothetical protein
MVMDAAKSPQFITCECGERILVIPDIKLMGNSIEAHAANHKKDPVIPSAADEDSIRIENLLIERLFKAVASSHSKL